MNTESVLFNMALASLAKEAIDPGLLIPALLSGAAGALSSGPGHRMRGGLIGGLAGGAGAHLGGEYLGPAMSREMLRGHAGEAVSQHLHNLNPQDLSGMLGQVPHMPQGAGEAAAHGLGAIRGHMPEAMQRLFEQRAGQAVSEGIPNNMLEALAKVVPVHGGVGTLHDLNQATGRLVGGAGGAAAAVLPNVARHENNQHGMSPQDMAMLRQLFMAAQGRRG